MHRQSVNRGLMFGCIAGLLMACTTTNMATPTMTPATHLTWDPSTLALLSEKGDTNWNGYPRLIQLRDDSLFLVYYNSSKGIMGRRSFDLGKTWEPAFRILPNSSTHAMDNPEIVQLHDGALLVSTNLRPHGGANNRNTDRRFQIGVIKSEDAGKSWSALKILYTASWSFKDGCWEPKAIQLPSGEVQLYFSNEAPYTHSDEQDISMLSSQDNGETWTTAPVIVSYRKGFRDGMATPIVLKGQDEIAMPIEDNGWLAPASSSFKISIIRHKTAEPWATVVGDTPNRAYALEGVVPKNGPYAGAPYIAQLPAGETILSFQSTYQRKVTSGNELDDAIPYVLAGDAHARNFKNISAPFNIPAGKHGLWNSVTALDNGEVIALTSSNGLSPAGRDEVWMIKGRLK